MGKGNMFQGMARGKVGDVVFSRLYGEQISRVRNRHPKNPRSNKQLYQRAIMATVMQAYSQGQEIFNHSFEGKSVGAMCQREFMRLNAKALRSRLAADIAGGDLTTTIGRVTAPGIATIVPNEYIISRGSYQNQVLTVDNDGLFSLPAVSGQETLAAYATRVGLIAGDIYTFVYIKTDDSEILFSALGDLSQPVDKVLRGEFGYVRCTVKDLSAVATEASAAKWGDIFTIEDPSGTSGVAGVRIDSVIDIGNICNADTDKGYAIGLIRSRLDVDLRSNSVMKVYNANTFGIYYNSLIEAWKKSTESIGDSDLILEGGDEI